MYTIFGKKLKELRQGKKLTQLELANEFYVSKSTICQWETNKQEPCLTDIVKIALFFDVTTDYLLGLEELDGRRIDNRTFQFTNIKNINIK